MKVSFICPTRNKARHVARAALSYLRQTYSPMEIVFFDQASTDGTLEILKDLASKYDGPNTVRVLSCPPHDYAGHAHGMNIDLQWLHDGRVEGDVLLWGNADDFAAPRRTERTVRAFQEFNPSWVSCIQTYVNESLNWEGESYNEDKRDRWIPFAEGVRQQVGSSGALAYARDLWDKYGPTTGIEQNDIVLPIFAFLERGMYYIAEPLHTYVKHASEANMGIGGQILAAKTPEDALAMHEVNAFNIASNWLSVVRRLQALAAQGVVIPLDAQAELQGKVWGSAQSFIDIRTKMTMDRVAPRGMHMRKAA